MRGLRPVLLQVMNQTEKGTLLQNTPIQLPVVHVVDCRSRIFAAFELDKAEPSVLFCIELASSTRRRFHRTRDRRIVRVPWSIGMLTSTMSHADRTSRPGDNEMGSITGTRLRHAGGTVWDRPASPVAGQLVRTRSAEGRAKRDKSCSEDCFSHVLLQTTCNRVMIAVSALGTSSQTSQQTHSMPSRSPDAFGRTICITWAAR